MATLPSMKTSRSLIAGERGRRRSGLKDRCPSNLRGSESPRCSVMNSEAPAQPVEWGWRGSLTLDRAAQQTGDETALFLHPCLEGNLPREQNRRPPTSATS